jgi:hypothetical protein
MSYIRALSNPEHLYIYESAGSGMVEVMCGARARPWVSRWNFLMPAREFEVACARYRARGEFGTSDSFCVREIWVDERTGRKLSAREINRPLAHSPRSPSPTEEHHGMRIELRYKRDYIRMWKVTWLCLVESAIWHAKHRRRKR